MPKYVHRALIAENKRGVLMPVTVIVGGQYGSEGKGKVACRFAELHDASIVVRVGGSNSGHTILDNQGEPVIFRHLPTAAILPDTICAIAAGSYIDADVLLEEIQRTNLTASRLVIDPSAVVITAEDKSFEHRERLKDTIGSTLSGTGAAVLNRIRRNNSVTFAGNHALLSAFVRPVRSLLREHLLKHSRVIIEGTQGYGLSLLHSPHYPNVTSRDTTAAGFLSETGLSPLDVDEIVLVIRSFPIRVSGNSGPLPHEISWQQLSDESRSSGLILERTSVTKQIRRVGRFDPAIVRDAIAANNPTHIVLNHLDYIDSCGSTSSRLTAKAENFVRRVEASIGASISYVGLDPSSLIARRWSPQKKHYA